MEMVMCSPYAVFEWDYGWLLIKSRVLAEDDWGYHAGVVGHDFGCELSDAMGEALVAGDLARFARLAEAAFAKTAMADLKIGVDMPMPYSLLPAAGSASVRISAGHVPCSMGCC
ncbi:hypothetical protein ACLOJK_003839 [Asimina triloba]